MSSLLLFARQLLLSLFNLQDALLGRWQVFRHRAAQLVDRVAYLLAYLKMRLVGALLALHPIAPQFLFGLRGAEQVRGQLRTAHVIQNLLALLQALAGVDERRAPGAVRRSRW